MKLMSIFGLAILIPFFQLALTETQLKLLEYITEFVNKSYVNTDPGELKVIKVNDTYSRLYIKAEIIQEFPLDTEFDVTVISSESNGTVFSETLADFTTFICDKDDPNRKYLPHNLIDMSRTDGQKCVQKGDYEYQDAGVFKFYDILSLEEGHYYESINVLRSNDILISTTRVRSQAINV